MIKIWFSQISLLLISTRVPLLPPGGGDTRGDVVGVRGARHAVAARVSHPRGHAGGGGRRFTHTEVEPLDSRLNHLSLTTNT